MRLKLKLFNIINENNKDNTRTKIFGVFISTLIISNILMIILESFRGLKLKYEVQFHYFDLISVMIFTLEYLIRLWTSDLKYPKKNRFKSLIKYITSPLAIIDLLSILPTYLPLLFPMDLRILRTLWLFRIIRLFKLYRYSKSLKLVGDVFHESKEDLGITVSLSLILLFISSTFIFFFEKDLQPNHFPNILASMWWAIVTMTTLGYGDVVPHTVLGKIVGGLLAILGIMISAIATAILSASFFRLMEKHKNIKESSGKICSKCGQPIKKNHHLY